LSRELVHYETGVSAPDGYKEMTNEYVYFCDHCGKRAETAKLDICEDCLTQSFWVVERFENGKSAGYWDGANSRSFQSEIDKAIQFRRQQDAFWATRGWHWTDVQITEHCYIGKAGAA
jgi:hypothetical protein